MPKPSKIITELAIQRRSDLNTPDLNKYPRADDWIAAIIDFLDSQYKAPVDTVQKDPIATQKETLSSPKPLKK